MAFIERVENIDKLDVNSWREYNFYLQYLSAKMVGFDRIKECDQIDECEREINKKIEYLIRKDRKLSGLISEMKNAFQATQLTLNDFKWNDKKEERFWNWAWCYLKENIQYDSRNGIEHKLLPVEDIGNQIMPPNFSLLSLKALNKDRNNSSDRQTDIIKAFHDGEAERAEQLEIIKFIDEEWKAVYKDKRIVEWLEENNNTQWSWALGYLEKIDRHFMKKAWEPGCDTEMRAAIIAAMDMLDDHVRKELFVGKLKRAWSQKKFRDKSDGKKAYSINMTSKTKERLDELAEHHELKLNEVIAKLIKREHDLIKNS